MRFRSLLFATLLAGCGTPARDEVALPTDPPASQEGPHAADGTDGGTPGNEVACQCAAGQRCVLGACVACSGAAGTFSGRTLTVGGEARSYFLHVPPSYDCAQAWPVLLDFHGTAGAASDAEAVEEYYTLPELLEVADAEKFVVVRPRSRSRDWQGRRVFQWDINPGDLEKNVALANAVMDALQAEYHLDPKRLYVSGFSNGTNMTAQLVGDGGRWKGFAFHAGGLWSTPTIPSLAGTDGPRFYATTGHRDYMLGTQKALLQRLAAKGLPEARLWVRESDTGHDLYDWHYRETFAWLDRGARPSPGNVAAPWQPETTGTTRSILELVRTGSGAVLAVASGGGLLRRDPATGAWSEAAHPTGPAASVNLTDVCLLASGRAVAIGEGQVLVSDDDGRSWSQASPVPEFGSANFGYSYLNGLGCQGSRITGGGYWAAVTSSDEGTQWSAAQMTTEFGAPPQITSVRASTSGTWMAVGGYGYLGRSTDGASFTPSSSPTTGWVNAVESGAQGRWWAVGAKGTVLRSTSDGVSWLLAPAATEADLYAVGFADATLGVAVGANGSVLRTRDGGSTWQSVPAGVDGFLGAVVWLDARTVLVGGENGRILRATFP